MRSWIHAALAVVVVSLAPSVASAVLQINVERSDAFPTTQDQIVFVEVFARDLASQTNEELTVFTLALNGIGFTPDGIRFLPPAGVPTAHPYVFKDFPGSEPDDINSTYNRMQISAELAEAGQPVDVTDALDGLARIPVFVPANAAPGFYAIVVDPAATQFAGAGAPIVAVPGQVGHFFPLLPEPAAPALACAAGALMLRRRARR